ncbi:MAG: hypothetical protein WA961_04435 [Rhodanobacter sp.]
MASVQDWGKAQAVGKPKSGNVAGLDRVQDRAAQSGASERMAATGNFKVKGFTLNL